MHEIKINDRITAVLTYDEDCPDPKDNMLGKIYYAKSSRYRLGTDAVDADRMQKISIGISTGELIGLPVYTYVHGNIQLSTTSFSHPFDSGLSGFIACSHEDVENWFGKHHCKSEEEVLVVLRGEVEHFNKFLQGDIYNIGIYVDGKEEETVGGFYRFDYAVEEAKELAEKHVKYLEKTVKVFLKTSTGKLLTLVYADNVDMLNKCAKLVEEIGCGEVHAPVVGHSMKTHYWKITAKGVKLVTTSSKVQEYGLIEISKFYQMLADKEVEGFKKVEDHYEET